MEGGVAAGMLPLFSATSGAPALSLWNIHAREEKILELFSNVEESISSLNIVTPPPTHLNSPMLGRRSKQI
jgi:hypothetical protein